MGSLTFSHSGSLPLSAKNVKIMSFGDKDCKNKNKQKNKKVCFLDKDLRLVYLVGFDSDFDGVIDYSFYGYHYLHLVEKWCVFL